MRDVILRITSMSFGVAGVVDANGHLVGVITDGDLRRHIDDLMEAESLDKEQKAVLEAYRMFAHSRGWLRRMEEAFTEDGVAEWLP